MIDISRAKWLPRLARGNGYETADAIAARAAEWLEPRSIRIFDTVHDSWARIDAGAKDCPRKTWLFRFDSRIGAESLIVIVRVDMAKPMGPDIIRSVEIRRLDRP